MNINKLRQLKQKLVDDKDLSKIWLFFMDNFADHMEFTELGETASHEYLDAVLHKICQQMFNKTTKITNFLLIYIPEHKFFHGSFLVKEYVGGVIYFEDIKTGLVAVSSESSPTDEVKYSRFSEPIKLSTPNRYELN